MEKYNVFLLNSNSKDLEINLVFYNSSLSFMCYLQKRRRKSSFIQKAKKAKKGVCLVSEAAAAADVPINTMEDVQADDDQMPGDMSSSENSRGVHTRQIYRDMTLLSTGG